MEVSLTDDKVEAVMRQIQKDEDVYVTKHGKVLRRNEKLKSCGVTDGCTIQVTSSMRGGGKHKDKKSKASQNAVSNDAPEILESKEEAIVQMWEENEGNRKFISGISEGSDVEMEQTQGMRWADYEDDEGTEQEEQETEKGRQEEAKQELTSETPPGLEQKEENKQEAREDEQSRAQEAREEQRRAQEAREEESRAQEAREEQRRAQEARQDVR